MADFSVGGRSANTAATANHAAAALWNGGTRVIWLRRIRGTKRVATADNHALAYITARGTAGSTVTPDADNHWGGRQLAPSSVVLDLAAYSVQPTLAAPPMKQSNLPATLASEIDWVFDKGGLLIPASTGVVVYTPDAVILQATDWTFIWSE